MSVKLMFWGSGKHSWGFPQIYTAPSRISAGQIIHKSDSTTYRRQQMLRETGLCSDQSSSETLQCFKAGGWVWAPNLSHQITPDLRKMSDLWGYVAGASSAPDRRECYPAQPARSWSCTTGCLLWSEGCLRATGSQKHEQQVHNPVPPQSPGEEEMKRDKGEEHWS